ncbi:MAG: dNTP triphosphohydrolase [Acidobacteriia bacterium]|nr:dNTP triphosphohydrolase [Terriglobia bacterium]
MERGKGRRYPELPHPFRNDFQRDRDRVVHARAFRRLENKTQVFTPGLSDHFRNRLTHTIEVSQIARTVARVLGLDEDLTEALALAHDIGHPPFGHAGEAELDRLMRQFGESFDHNLHALRIVESFENPYPRFPGLNLTFEVREGMAKHSSDCVPAEYFPDLRPPIEAQLIDLCDEIAYNTSDLDDGFGAGLITFDEARAVVEKFRDLDETASQQFPAATEHLRIQEIVRGLINWLVVGLIEGTVAGAAGLQDVDAVRRHPRRVAQFSAEQAEGTAQLKELLRARVYYSEALAEARQASVQRIGKLFERYMESPELMPADYREESSGEPRYRQVCDYIAGMTDRFLVRTCEHMGIE